MQYIFWQYIHPYFAAACACYLQNDQQNCTKLGTKFQPKSEFSHLIEENEDGGTSSSLATKDKASKKQLKWEKNNDDFMKNKKWKNVKKNIFNKGNYPHKKSQKPKK